MARTRSYLGRLTIANGQQVSNSLGARELSMAEAIIFYNAAAYTGTISVKVGQKEDTVVGSHQALDNNGSAVQLAAARAQRHGVNGFESVSVSSSVGEGAQRDIDVYMILDL